MITWEVSEKDEGIHDIKVLISDKNGGDVMVPYTTTIAFEKQTQ
jgi:hypothetical protein